MGVCMKRENVQNYFYMVKGEEWPDLVGKLRGNMDSQSFDFNTENSQVRACRLSLYPIMFFVTIIDPTQFQKITGSRILADIFLGSDLLQCRLLYTCDILNFTIRNCYLSFSCTTTMLPGCLAEDLCWVYGVAVVSTVLENTQ